MRFESGDLVQTVGIAELSQENDAFGKFIRFSLRRHLSGDWGDICDEDKKMNEESVNEFNRLFSAYDYIHDNGKKTKIYIITEADRAATTVLFPEEY